MPTEDELEEMINGLIDRLTPYDHEKLKERIRKFNKARLLESLEQAESITKGGGKK